MKKLFITTLLLLTLPLSCFGAINALTQWEIRTTGAVDNGANFYDADPGTSVDYSQQDSPELTLTDIVTNGTTTITSVTGGFTAAMAGNGIYLDDTGDWYQITVYSDTNTVTIDRAGGTASGVTGKVGGASSYTDDAIWSAGVPGNLYWVKSGSYSSFATNISDNQNWWSIIGYQTTRGDCPTGTDRPLFDLGAYYMQMVTQNHLVANMRITSSNAAYTYYVQANSIVFNTDLINTGNGVCIQGWTDTGIINSYLSANNNKAFDARNGGAYAINSYLKGTYGFYNDHVSAPLIIGCIVEGSTAAVFTKDQSYHPIIAIDSTIFGGGSGIGVDIGLQTTYAQAGILLNNIVQGWTTGMSTDADYGARYSLDYNNWYDNTADVLNMTKGSNATTLNPTFTDSGSGDFSVTNSNFNNQGLAPSFGGLSTSYNEQGAVQRATATPASTPTFSGATFLLRVDTGLKVYWDDATGTVTTYNIYAKADNDTDLYTEANLIAKVPNTANDFYVNTLPNGSFLLGTTVYYIGVRAENDGSEDTNTATRNSSPMTRWIPQRVSNGIVYQ